MLPPQQTASPEYMATTYFDYQKCYATTMRESDKALLALMAEALAKAEKHGARLLDVGCSNGNLLRHLRRIAPKIEYWGGDIQPEVIKRCRIDPDLLGIRFELMNVRDLSAWPTFDIIVTNAVLFRFSDFEFESICSEISRALAPTGYFFSWDFYHPFEQELTVVDRSTWHPEGLLLHMRSMKNTQQILRRCGLVAVEFAPFEIPIDLPMPEDASDIRTYTRSTADGARLQFRGVIYQPWCHLIARKT
jgi:SAM-dependent methyltransferase